MTTQEYTEMTENEIKEQENRIDKIREEYQSLTQWQPRDDVWMYARWLERKIVNAIEVPEIERKVEKSEDEKWREEVSSRPDSPFKGHNNYWAYDPKNGYI